MRARFRSAAVLAAAFATLVAVAPNASAEDPIGGPRLAGSDVVVDTDPGTPEPPTVDATSYVLADLETGEILAAKAAHRRLRPASTLKMLTALALLPELDLDDKYTATYEDDAQIGSAVGIVEGSTYTIDELFLGLFLASGNDAAHALANAVGGMPTAVRLMREETKRIQALDTTPMNTSGLDADGQLSSAYDLALIGRAGLQIEEFREYARTESAQFPDAERDSTYAISNHNQLLGRYPGAIGIKNGYTSKSGYTYVGAAERGGRGLIVSLMQGESNVQQEAAALMDWGFAYGDAVEPVGVLVDPIPDEPTAPATPTAAGPREGASQGGPADDGAIPLSVIATGLTVLVGGVSIALTFRRVQRRRALRAELQRWASQPRWRPITPYGPNSHPPGPQGGPPPAAPPAGHRLPPLALPPAKPARPSPSPSPARTQSPPARTQTPPPRTPTPPARIEPPAGRPPAPIPTGATRARPPGPTGTPIPGPSGVPTPPHRGGRPSAPTPAKEPRAPRRGQQPPEPPEAPRPAPNAQRREPPRRRPDNSGNGEPPGRYR